MANQKKQAKTDTHETESMKEESILGLREIEILLETLEKHEVTEFKLERENEKVWLKRGTPQANPMQMPYMMQPMGAYPYPQYAAPTGAPAYPQGSADPGNAGHSAANAPLTVVSSAPAPVLQGGKNTKEIRSPMVGTFYRRPAVDAEPYVKVGDMVKKGDVLCIVEAMKLMNEIESEVSGKISEICLEDGQMVEYGEVLYRVELS